MPPREAAEHMNGVRTVTSTRKRAACAHAEHAHVFSKTYFAADGVVEEK